MKQRSHFTSCRPLKQRLTSVAMLLVYINAAVASPLPTLKQKRPHLVQPYPCQDRPCGCSCAEDCWRGCCCFTVEERWAWATDHGITPPEYAEKPASSGSSKTSDKPSSCCSAVSDRSKSKPGAQAGKAGGGLPAFSAHQCKSSATKWIASGEALPVTPTADWQPYRIAERWLVYFENRPFVSFHPPDTPPPR